MTDIQAWWQEWQPTDMRPARINEMWYGKVAVADKAIPVKELVKCFEAEKVHSSYKPRKWRMVKPDDPKMLHDFVAELTEEYRQINWNQIKVLQLFHRGDGNNVYLKGFVEILKKEIWK